MVNGPDDMNRRSVLRWVGRIAAASAIATWAPGAFAGTAQPTPKPGPRRLIVLDPGHGGVDPGAISPQGIYEKDITLSTASELARQLEATGRFRIVLTRSGDIFVPLRERVARARAAHA